MDMKSIVLILLSALSLGAQDAFETQVYEYETVPKGMWNLETHLNYTPNQIPMGTSPRHRHFR